MTTSSRITRRTALSGAAVSAGAALGAVVPSAARACTADEALAALAAIEARHHRRLGLYARNLRTGRTLSHRPDERFALCGTFAPFAVGALVGGRLATPDPHVLTRRVHYPPSLVAGDLRAPRTRAWLARGHAPSVAEVCEAAVREGDDGAANLVVQHLGGPEVVTGLFGDLGDGVSRLDRWAPEPSASLLPGQVLDTATPRSLGTSFAALLRGHLLGRRERALLLGWLRGHRPDAPFRTTLPTGWSLADTSGAGAGGARNDIGIAWSPPGVPLLVSCLTRADDAAGEGIDAPLAEAFAVAVEVLR